MEHSHSFNEVNPNQSKSDDEGHVEYHKELETVVSEGTYRVLPAVGTKPPNIPENYYDSYYQHNIIERVHTRL